MAYKIILEAITEFRKYKIGDITPVTINKENDIVCFKTKEEARRFAQQFFNGGKHFKIVGIEPTGQEDKTQMMDY